METYIDLKYVPQPAHAKALHEFFQACRSADENELGSLAAALGPEFVERLDTLFADSLFVEFLGNIDPELNATSCDLSFTAGGSTLDFLIGVLKLIGPCTQGVSATYSHDEEDPEEGEYPYQLYWRNGRVEGSSGKAIESEDDVYAQFASG